MSGADALRIRHAGLPVIAGILLATICCGISRAQNGGGPLFTIPHVGRLPEPRQTHGSAVVGNRLYVIGGVTAQGITQGVISAEISGAAATVGAWREETPLPELRHHIRNSMQVVGNNIYIIGGSVAPRADAKQGDIGYANDVLWATCGANGKLGEWKRTVPFPGLGVTYVGTCSDSKRIAVLGGLAGTTVQSAIYLANLGPDGSPGPWQVAGNLPIPLYSEGATLVDGNIHVWAGLPTVTVLEVNDKCWRTVLSDEGKIGPWSEEARMPYAVQASAYGGFGNLLMCVAGRYADNQPTNVIWHTRIENGGMQPWQLLKTDLETRAYHSLGHMPATGCLFVVGGRSQTTKDGTSGMMVDAVQAFRL